MKRTWHQLAPAVPVQQVIDRAVAGGMCDRFLVSRPEIMDVEHLAGSGCFGKPCEQGLFFGQRHVLMFASTIRLGHERLDAAVAISHVRAVHRAQRYAHRTRDRRLRHPAFTQQHHLDALALRRWYVPAQRRSQPPHLGFAAFDHLLPRISPDGRANHTSANKNKLTVLIARKLSIQAVMELVLEAQGAKIVRPPEEGPWAQGYYSVLFEDPSGIRIEINHVPGKGLLEDGAVFNSADTYR